MTKKTPALLVFLLLAQWVFSQNTDLKSIKLNGLYCCNLDAAFTEISKKHPIRFVYDKAQFEQIKFSSYPMDKPLDLFLDQLCKANKLKYFFEDSVTLRVVDKWYDSSSETINEEKHYNGNPIKTDITLTGRVIDQESRETLPYVAVMVKGTNIGTLTNVDGYFTLLKVPSDTATILISYLGYDKKDIYLNPQSQLEDLLIELKSNVVNLQEVNITAEKQDILQVSNIQPGIIKMVPKKLSTLPNLGEKDILRSFQLMPGVSAANENSSGLYVRGGTPDQVLVLYDGFTVYNVEHMFGFFSAFNSNAIKDVQLYKGGFDTKYGGRLASVLEITGKDGNQKTFNAALDMSMMSINSFIEFPIKDKITATFAFRRSWESPIYNKIFDQFSSENTSSDIAYGGRGFGPSENQQTVSYFYDFNGKLTWRAGEKDIFAFSVYNGKDNLDNSLTPRAPMSLGGEDFELDLESVDLTYWGNTGGSVKWSHKVSDKFYINTLLGFSNYFSVRERSTAGFFARGDEDPNAISRAVNEDNNLLDYTVKADFEYELSEFNHLEFGFQGTYNDIDYTYLQNDTVTVIDRSTQGEVLSTYLQDNIPFLEGKLMLTPGLRLNYFSETQKLYYEPRFQFMYKLNENFRLKGSAGQYYQFAKRVIREDITSGSRDFWVLSDNENLPVSSSLQYVLGFSYETPKYVFDVEAYYKNLKNITEYSLRIQADRTGVDYSENFYTGTGFAEGIDFLLQKKSGKLTGWIGYTLGRAINHIEAFGDYDFYASNDVTHEFKTVVSYQYKDWVFGATWIYTTGRPYTAPEGGYQLTLLDGTVVDYINVSVKNGKRLPDYHRFDISATYNFTLGQAAPASIGVSLFNAYNRKNVWYNEYEIIDNNVIETPVYFLGLTPNINLTIKLK